MTQPRDQRGRFLPRKGKPAPRRRPEHMLNPATPMPGAGTQEALVAAIWEFVLNGEVRLNGHILRAENSREWAAVVKLLYTYLSAPPPPPAEEAEVVVRVVRDADKKRS